MLTFSFTSYDCFGSLAILLSLGAQGLKASKAIGVLVTTLPV